MHIILIVILVFGLALFLTFFPDIVMYDYSSKNVKTIEVDSDELTIRNNNNLTPIEKSIALQNIHEIKEFARKEKEKQIHICLNNLVCPSCGDKLERECTMYFEDAYDDLYTYKCLKCEYTIDKYE